MYVQTLQINPYTRGETQRINSGNRPAYAMDYPTRPSTRNAYALSGARQNLFLVLRENKTLPPELISGEQGQAHALAQLN